MAISIFQFENLNLHNIYSFTPKTLYMKCVFHKKKLIKDKVKVFLLILYAIKFLHFAAIILHNLIRVSG